MAIRRIMSLDLGWRNDGTGANLFTGRLALSYALLSPSGLLIQPDQSLDVEEVSEAFYVGEPEFPDRFRGVLRWIDPETSLSWDETVDFDPQGVAIIGDGTPLGGGDTIPAAIKDRVQNIPDLIDRLPGGWWFGTPDEDADDNPPYAVLTWIAGKAIYDTCGLAGYRDFYQVSLVGLDFDELELIARLWRETYFNPGMSPLTIEGRVFSVLYNGDISADIGDPVPSPQATNTVVVRWTFEILTGVVRS
jgi:hypothetical protein